MKHATLQKRPLWVNMKYGDIFLVTLKDVSFKTGVTNCSKVLIAYGKHWEMHFKSK